MRIYRKIILNPNIHAIFKRSKKEKRRILIFGKNNLKLLYHLNIIKKNNQINESQYSMRTKFYLVILFI